MSTVAEIEAAVEISDLLFALYEEDEKTNAPSS